MNQCVSALPSLRMLAQTVGTESMRSATWIKCSSYFPLFRRAQKFISSKTTSARIQPGVQHFFFSTKQHQDDALACPQPGSEPDRTLWGRVQEVGQAGRPTPNNSCLTPSGHPAGSGPHPTATVNHLAYSMNRRCSAVVHENDGYPRRRL